MLNGERIRQVRELLKLTQTALAADAGIHQATLAKIERGELVPPDVVVQAIALRTGFAVGFFHKPSGPEFPLGSLLFRAHASATIRERTEAYRYAQLIYEIADSLLARMDMPPLRLPRIQENPAIAAGITRAQLGLSPDTPILNLTNTIESAGILVLAVPVALEERDAFSLWVGDEPARRPVIFLTEGRPPDRQRFSLAHELGHLVLHSAIRGQITSVEAEANQFAAEFLMPEQSMRRDIVPPVTLRSIAQLKPRWRVAVQALIRRAFELEIITKRQYGYMFERLSQMGWRKKEPSELDIPVEKPRALRQMAELVYGTPLNCEKIATHLELPVRLVREIIEAHAARNSATGISNRIVPLRVLRDKAPR